MMYISRSISRRVSLSPTCAAYTNTSSASPAVAAARYFSAAAVGEASAVKTSWPLSKIVATIGPASEQLEPMKKVTQAGLSIMRINFSHATYDEADLRTNNLRQCPGVGMGLGEDNMRAVLLDTQGPEVRSGSFGNGLKEVEFVKGQQVTLTIDNAFQKNQSADTLWVSYDKLPNTVNVGDSVLLDDGSLELKVVSKKDGKILCEAQNNCLLGNKKGVNFPGLKVELPMMCEKDKEDLKWGIKNDIDFIAASFTRKASDVVEMRDYIRKLMIDLHGKEKGPHMPLPRIISKIENTEGLDNIDDIIRVSDGIMVARGDLGVEIPLETLTRWQKRIVRKCNLQGKPVVVATQMLESMQKNPRPTRAECTDVANACFDGTDCVMLSGESAKGRYPWGSVDMQRKLIIDAERAFRDPHEKEYYPQVVANNSNSTFSLSVVKPAVSMAEAFNASCIISFGNIPAIAGKLAALRPNVPIVHFVNTAKNGRLLQIHRGVYPVLIPEKFKSVDAEDGTKTIKGFDSFAAVAHAVELGFCSENDKIVLIENRKPAQLVTFKEFLNARKNKEKSKEQAVNASP